MNKEKLSIGNIIWTGGYAWEVVSIASLGVYTHMFGQSAVSKFIRFEDIKGIPITIENVKTYLGIKMEMDDEGDWYDKETHQIRLSKTQWMLNRSDIPDAEVWFCHLDSQCMDTIGTADIAYINELQNFLNIFK